MPYKIVREGGEYVVKKKDGSKTFGRHASRAKASAQIRAIHANSREK